MFDEWLYIARLSILEYNKTFGNEISFEDLTVAAYKDMLGKVEFLIIPISQSNLLYKVIVDVDHDAAIVTEYVSVPDKTLSFNFLKEETPGVPEEIPADDIMETPIEETEKSEE